MEKDSRVFLTHLPRKSEEDVEKDSSLEAAAPNDQRRPFAERILSAVELATMESTANPPSRVLVGLHTRSVAREVERFEPRRVVDLAELRRPLRLFALLAGTLVVSPPATALKGDKPDVEQTTVSQAAVRVPGRGANAVRGRQLSPEMVQRCLEVAPDVDPELAERLETLRKTRGETAFERSIRRARHLVGLVRLKDRDPRLYDVKVQELQLDAKVTRTLEALREARDFSGDGTILVDNLEEALYQLVRTQVSLSIASRGMYFQVLQDHVKAARAQLDEEGKNFRKTVEKRYRELLEELEAESEPELTPLDTG